MNEDLENLKKIIRNPLLSRDEQQELLDLLEKEGETEEMCDKIQTIFEQAIKRQVAKAGNALQDFDEEVKAAEEAMEQAKQTMAREVEQKLNEVAPDDIQGADDVLDDHHGKVSALYRDLEEQIRGISAKALLKHS